MLTCCNGAYAPVFCRTLQHHPFYRRIEYGKCPVCGCEKFKDLVLFEDGKERIKFLSGKAARLTYQRWQNKLNSQKYCSFANQNVYYGDFRKTKRSDIHGNPIYYQLRKNFNNQIEILNLIETRILTV